MLLQQQQLEHQLKAYVEKSMNEGTDVRVASAFAAFVKETKRSWGKKVAERSGTRKGGISTSLQETGT